MELVNQTPATTMLTVSQISADVRLGMLVAKLTFRVDPHDGRISVADSDPIPVFDGDQSTELGVLPSDLLADRDPGVHVVLLGVAHATGGRAAREQLVSLRVGDTTRQLRVSGDRYWAGSGNDAAITAAAPFIRMPLTWERAFGGGGDVWIDANTPIPVHHAGNPGGKGFDLDGAAHHIGSGWQAPSGFPRVDYARELPNIEHPLDPVRSWGHDPEPYCWAPMPLSMAAYRYSRAAAVQPRPPPSGAIGHPDWRLASISAGDPIVLEGCTSSGTWWFQWPALRVISDYEIGSKRGVRVLEPYLVVLLPEESRFTVSLRTWFRFRIQYESVVRSMRLRVETVHAVQ